MTPSPERRRGVFLIEVMVVIVASVLVLGAAAALMSLLLRLGREQRAAMVIAAALDDLALDVRDDVRAAESAEVGDEGRRIELARPDGHRVTYRIEGPTIVREQAEGDRIARRESYSAGRGAAAAWSIAAPEGTGRARLISLEIRRPGLGRDRAGTRIARVVRVDSVLALDRRHFHSGGADP